jgi:hypothetical protein
MYLFITAEILDGLNSFIFKRHYGIALEKLSSLKTITSKYEKTYHFIMLINNFLFWM